MKLYWKNWLLGVLLMGAAGGFVACDTTADNPVTPVTPEKKTYGSMMEALNDMAIVEQIVPLEPGEFKEHYVVYVKQAMDHLSGDKTFKQKLVVRFRGFDRPTVMLTHGYNLDNDSEDGRALAQLLDANMVEVEHRNFGESMVNDAKRWEYETQYQEAADLHTVFTAFKPVLPGKWMSTGTSKNGETSIDYGNLYPDDMDLCSAFCSPLMNSLYDVKSGKYMLEESGTKEERAIADAGIKRYLANGEQGFYKTFCERLEKEGIKKPSYSEYVFNAMETYFSSFSYYKGEKRKEQLGTGTDSDTEDFLYKRWKGVLTLNRDPMLITYYVDACRWQGIFQYDYDRYKNLLEGTSFSPRGVNMSLIPEEVHGYYDLYSNSYRLELLDQRLPFKTQPTLLVYSKDDPWTGGRPTKTNPLSTKVLINPDGVHGAQLLEDVYYSPETRQEIMNFVKQYIN